MFGFGFAVYVFLFALSCSYLARVKNRDTNIWWLAGLMLGVIPFVYLLFAGTKKTV